MKHPLLVTLCIAAGTLVPVHGEDLLPELAPAAQQHKAASAAIAEQKAAAIAAARQLYLAALDAADQAGTAAGSVQIVNAVAKEREAVAKGGMTESFPKDLPKNLQGPRKTYVNAIEHIVTDFGKRQNAADSTYLRSIAAVQPKAATNPTLAAQILSEKQRLLTGIHGPISDLRTGLTGSRWRKIGGDSEWNFLPNGTLNGHWKYEALAADKLRIIWAAPSKTVTLSLGKDGKTLVENGKPAWELILE